jgi:hypothetical protein
MLIGQDNKNKNLKETGWEGGEGVNSIWFRVMVHWQALLYTVIHFRILQNVGNFLSNCETISFSRGFILFMEFVTLFTYHKIKTSANILVLNFTI